MREKKNKRCEAALSSEFFSAHFRVSYGRLHQTVEARHFSLRNDDVLTKYRKEERLGSETLALWHRKSPIYLLVEIVMNLPLRIYLVPIS